MRSPLVLLGLLLSAQACRPAPAAIVVYRPGPPPAPTVVEPTPAVVVPESGCEVGVRTSVVPLGEWRFELVATAVSQADRPIVTTMFFRCPGSAAHFDGLPAGYDVGDLCRAGPCPGGATRSAPLELAPGEAREVARVTIDAAAGDCNAALPPGTYSVGATVALEGVQACSTGRATFAVEAAPTPTPYVRPEPPPHPVQPPPTPAPTRPAPEPRARPTPPRERCPAMGCAYTPCPPGVEPPTGCAAVCGCPGAARGPTTFTP